MNIMVQIALSLLLALWLALLAAYAYCAVKRRFGDRPAYLVAFLVMSVATAIVAQKASTFAIDSFLENAGCYSTNDVVHVEIRGASQYLPADFNVLVYYRDGESTNAEDWAQLPTYRWSEYAATSNGARFVEYALADATNYNFAVFASFVPEPTVHTNVVLQIRGFVIPEESGGNGARFAFPNSKTRKTP